MPRASEERTPGWYPDEKLDHRFRLWDGHRWRHLTSSAPVWGPLDPAEQQPALGRAMSPVAIAASVLLVAALLGGGIWASLRGEDGDRVASANAVEVAGETVERNGDGSGATTGNESGGENWASDAVQDCPQLEAELTTVAKNHPGLVSVSGTVTVTGVRCSASWASGQANSAVTPRSRAVFERQDDAWALVGYAETGACSQLGLDPALAEALACN